MPELRDILLWNPWTRGAVRPDRALPTSTRRLGGHATRGIGRMAIVFAFERSE